MRLLMRLQQPFLPTLSGPLQSTDLLTLFRIALLAAALLCFAFLSLLWFSCSVLCWPALLSCPMTVSLPLGSFRAGQVSHTLNPLDSFFQCIFLVQLLHCTFLSQKYPSVFSISKSSSACSISNYASVFSTSEHTLRRRPAYHRSRDGGARLRGWAGGFLERRGHGCAGRLCRAAVGWHRHLDQQCWSVFPLSLLKHSPAVAREQARLFFLPRFPPRQTVLLFALSSVLPSSFCPLHRRCIPV